MDLNWEWMKQKWKWLHEACNHQRNYEWMKQKLEWMEVYDYMKTWECTMVHECLRVPGVDGTGGVMCR